MGCIANALDAWLCICLAEDCIGCTLDLYSFFIFLVCENSEELHLLGMGFVKVFDVCVCVVYIVCTANDLDWFMCMCMADDSPGVAYCCVIA